MKVMVSLTAFEGADPSSGERRGMTIGRIDTAELAQDVGRWAHDVTLRMLAGDAQPAEPDEPEDIPEATAVVREAVGYSEQKLPW